MQPSYMSSQSEQSYGMRGQTQKAYLLVHDDNYRLEKRENRVQVVD